MQEFINRILGSFSANAVDIAVYVAIVLVFIIGLIKCVLPVSRNRRILARAVRSIRAGDDAKRSWQDDSFLGKGALRAHWSDYLNNLFFADGTYQNASNVEDYINEETVIYGPGRASFSDAVPGLLVSIGFLGTLIGLARGLSGFSMDSSEAVMSSIVTLIPGMRYAFLTSIFGVVGSVLFTVITRAVQGSTGRTLRLFYGAMSRAGIISVDPMTQVAIYQQEQTAMIRELTEKLGDSICDSVGKAVEPMNDALKDFVTVTTKEQMRFLDAVVGRFVERMDIALGREISELKKALQDAATGQEITVSALKQSLRETGDLIERVRQSARTMSEAVESSAKNIESLEGSRSRSDAALARLADIVERIDSLGTDQAACLKGISAVQAQVTRGVGEMNASLKGFTEKATENAALTSGEIIRASQELRRTGEELGRIHAECTAAIRDELKDTMDAYQDYVNQFTRRVDQLAGGIGASIAKLPPAVDESTGRFLDEIDRLTDALIEARRLLDGDARR